MIDHIPAGELARKAKSDSTDYNLLELGHAVTEDIIDELRKCREYYNKIYDENEYCIVRQCAGDCLINNAKRYKYYGWLYLPSPRPDQTVFLYNKSLDMFSKRLWSLPSAARMAQLASTDLLVPKEYQKMQAWSVAFFKGTFWEYIRHEHNIDMLSEHEFFLKHREELIQSGCQPVNPDFTEAFDFGKIAIEKAIDTVKPMIN